MFNAPAEMRRLLARPEPLVRIAVSDPLMARVAQKAGFNNLMLGGFGLGALSCRPEPLLDLTQLAMEAAAIQRAVTIPVVADVGGGFGESIHVWNTVRRLEESGAAGMQMDDQVYPKRAHYHRDYQEHTITQEHMIEKIRTAVESRKDKNFCIVCRTDTMKTVGYAEGIKRANAYAKAGADALFAFPNNPKETENFPKDCEVPVGYVIAHGNRIERPTPSTQELTEMGYKFLSYSVIGTLSAYKGMTDALTTLFKTGKPNLSKEELITARKDLEELIGLEDLYRIEELTTERDGAEAH